METIETSQTGSEEMNLSPEEKEIGRENYYEVIGVSRRDFMKRVVAAGAVFS